MCISDPETDKASAAMDVLVGSYMDPPDIPGLAHFLEHLLFMGTEKYPKENDYSEFLANHSGHSNAYTSNVNTNYFFEVAHEYLEPAIDRFAQFFICPLFNRDGVERELNAVDSEFKKNLSSDARRIFAVAQECANQKHPFSNFGCGDKRTLKEEPEKNGVDVVARLIEFYERFYSANMMKLVVVGRESVDELEKMVVDRFSKVKNFNAEPITFGRDVFPETILSHLIIVKPIKDFRRLIIKFVIDDQLDHWRSKPAHYASHLIGHESEGSIFSLLKSLGWSTALSASSGTSARGYDLFSISVDLTKEGLKNYLHVLNIIFYYIRFVRDTRPQLWIHEEVEKLSDLSFRYKDKSPSSALTSRTASDLQFYPPEYAFYGPYVCKGFDPQLIEDCVLSKLIPENAMFALVAQEIPEMFSGAKWKQEKWYGTEYSIVEFAETVQNLKNIQLSVEHESKLFLPSRNPFVPDEIKDDVIEISQKEFPEPPILLHKTEICRLWYKKDDRFQLPKSNLFAFIKSPQAYVSPFHAAMVRLYVELVKDRLVEFAYMADIAGLQYSFEVHVEGISIVVSGFSDKLFVLFQKIIEIMRNFETDEKMFQVQLDKQRRNCRNWSREPAHQLAMYYTSHAVQNQLFTPAERLNELMDDSNINLQNLYSFLKDFFRHVHVDVLFHGNLKQENVRDQVMTILTTELIKNESKPIPVAAMPSQRTFIIPEGNLTYVRHSDDETNPNSSVEFLLYCGDCADVATRTKALLLKQMIMDPVFNQLRTKEQLGYVVWGIVRKNIGFMGLRIIVMGDFDSMLIEQRIEAFLELFEKEILLPMTDELFQQHVESVIKDLSKRDENMGQESGRWWKKITTGYYDFLEAQVDISFLKTLKKLDLVEFFYTFISAKSLKRRKFSTHIRSCVPPKELRDLVSNLQSDLPSILQSIQVATGRLLLPDELFVLAVDIIMKDEPSEEEKETNLELLVKELMEKIIVRLKSIPSDFKEPLIQTGMHKIPTSKMIGEEELLRMKSTWLLGPAASPRNYSILNKASL